MHRPAANFQDLIFLLLLLLLLLLSYSRLMAV